jgi:hypothetical protein
MAKLIDPITGTKFDTDIKLINPQVAKQMLSTSFTNRKPQKARIKRYAQAMKNDEWIIAQPLMMNCDGSLIDGQHRLRAVCLSGLSIYFMVIKGFERDHTFGKIDDVGPRRLKDWLHVQGENLPDVLAVVIHMAAMDQTGRIPTGSPASFQFTPIEGVDFLKRYPLLRESVNAPGTTNQLAPRGMCCFAHYKFAALDKVLADSFFVDLIIGEKEGEGDPIYLLRERLKSNRLAKQKLTKNERLALIFKTWNAVRAGKTLNNLRWRSTGPMAEKFPEVI